uniref:Uncharacterized protein n=1 Tax=Utricularia reniformis TaxID=192314 RepID=A0A1Y0B4S5_9LAMI|nr:hypothetical protein AEK19_MT2245 [Utricularia reniformis]ART32390.1 hypothetical protein AEK19_MT2245 [Utricularia reniformis]
MNRGSRNSLLYFNYIRQLIKDKRLLKVTSQG